MGQRDFYWVIGEGTDIGKTTLATALLRIFNRRRHPAIGFKPYSAVLLSQLADESWEIDPAAGGMIAGLDARKLALSSPLTSADDIECIVPVQYVCHPHFHSALLARTGSRAIGDKALVRSDHHRAFLDRPDIAAFFDRRGIALGEMAAAEHLKLAACPGHSQDEVVRSFDHLTARDGIAAIVCEGIGQFLPVWRDMPVVDHLLHVGMNAVRLFPNIRLSLDGRRYETLQTSKMIDHLLGGGAVSAVLPLAPAAERARVAEEVIETLLSAAGLAR